ncbi:UPF0481 protein At3g47200-like [Oryza brachyantha]|nr:UPF0481 protein At3g47200-like [Oryza brachyantha]
MNRLVISMTHELDYYWSLGEVPDNGQKPCVIYKVQEHIRMVDKFSYEPCVLSIGLYHHGALALQTMQKEKWSYLDYVLNINCEKSLLDYLLALEDLAKAARSCYSDDIKMDDEEFLQMLLLDGCFVLVALGGTKGVLACGRQVQMDSLSSEEAVAETGGQKRSHPDDVKEANEIKNQTSSQDDKEGVQRTKYDEEIGQWFFRFLIHDLFLLENQIPFFIVEKIFKVVAGDVCMDPPFTHDIANYVECALRWFPKSIQEYDRPKDFHHLLHLCHMYFRPSHNAEVNCQTGQQYFLRFLSFGRKYFRLGHYLDETENSSSFNLEMLPSQDGHQLNRWRRTAQYLEAGAKFMKRKNEKSQPHSLLDIKFSNGTMEIPCIVVDEYTGTLFRNLIAFEQTCPQFGDDFTSYIVFLSQLISMPEDVTLLARRQIIVHHLESDEMVSDLFTMLSKDVVFDFNGQYYLKSLCQTMETYYQSRLNRWIAWLWLNHFRNPWLVLAAFATAIVLLCTIVQTVYGILAYVNPPGSNP